MNISLRDKKTQLASGGLVAALIAAIYIVMPLATTWSDLGTQLAPKLAQVAQLRVQVQGQKALIAKRDALAKRMGSLLGRPAGGEDAKGGPAGVKPSGAKAPASAKPETGKNDEKKPGDKTGPAPAVEKAVEPQSGKPASATPIAPAGSPAVASPTAPAAAPMMAAAKPVSPASASPTAPSGSPAAVVPSPPSQGTANAGAPGKESGNTAALAKAVPDGKPGEAKAEKEKTNSPAVEKGAGAPEADKRDERLAAYFERSAAQAGIKIKRVTSKKGGAGKGKYYTPITLQLSIEGKADNVVKLLYALEKGDRFVRVEQMELRRDTAKGNAIEASLDILGYERQ